jgi:hypothetical protein
MMPNDMPPLLLTDRVSKAKAKWALVPFDADQHVFWI